MESVLAVFLTLGLIVLALFSLNLATLALARILSPRRRTAIAEDRLSSLPEVLIQLPLFNEGDLVERVLGAVAAIDWPRDRLQIQVLDDSVDGSLAQSQSAVVSMQRQGFRIELRHRAKRVGFKAGALAAGLEHSNAPFVAIFDADFLPPPDFLRKTVAVLAAQPELAYVQTRWTHANRDQSLLTRVQARLLDSHFCVEQEARWRLGLPVPFNGTCGVWRRAAIMDAGGWAGDTLTEDLDLSVRASLRGWQSAYLPELTVPGILPVSARAWRAQQFRWTKGFVQCFVKLTPRIWQSQSIPFWQKLMLGLQLGQPLAFLTGITCVALGFPFIAGAMVGGDVLRTVAVAASLLGLAAPVSFLALAGPVAKVRQTALEIFAALALTSGLLVSNARAGLEALFGHRSDFVRTPKARSASGGSSLHWRCGLVELSAGLGLLGFVLLHAPIALVYLATLIGGLLGLGAMQLLDDRLTSQSVKPREPVC
jgi:cellulose synthase/poly-beta-1,6-N-acetylglucosamine synthase-like glycosyltransferase